MQAKPVLATSSIGPTQRHRPFGVLELIAAAIIVFFVSWGGLWFTQNSGFTLYTFQNDSAVGRLHYPQWYALRIVHYSGSKQSFVEHIGSPYATLAACQASLLPAPPLRAS
jgi:hypothetical protein